MKKIYIVLVRRFFNNNGADYAMAIDSVGDINTFSSKKKALEFHESLVEKCKKCFWSDANELKGKVFGDETVRTTEFSYDNTRIYISTIIKDIH